MNAFSSTIKNIYKLSVLLLGILSWNNDTLAQPGGQSAFEFLRLAPSARILALGGVLISKQDSDIVMAQNNPALLNAAATRTVSINQAFYFAGSRYSNLGLGYDWSKHAVHFHLAAQHLSYGSFQGSDEIGNKTTPFQAADLAILAGVSKKLFDQLSLGVNLKYIHSKIESYSSNGIATDLGLFYTLKETRKHLGMVIKNIGSQFDPYDLESDKLPLDLQIGYSQTLAHVPVTFNITGHHLQKWNMLYDNPDENSTAIFGEEIKSPSKLSKTLDNIARHLIFGAEILIGANAPLRLRFSYNHQRHQELKDQNYRGLSGFAGGLGIKMSRIVFDYSLANYHIAGTVHAIGLTLKYSK